MKPLLTVFLFSLLSLPACQVLRTATGELEEVPLTDSVWQLALVSGHLLPHPNTSATPFLPTLHRSAAGTPLSVAKLIFQEGFSVCGSATFVFTPNGHAARVRFLAGVDDASPDHTTSSHVELRSDGRKVWSARLSRGMQPQSADLSLPAARHLILRIVAPTGVYTDILLPRLTGTPGLRAALLEGRRMYTRELTAAPIPPSHPGSLPNRSVVFPVNNAKYPDCIGLSNQHLCLIVSLRGGALLHCGPDCSRNFLAAPSTISLHPRNRRLAPASSFRNAYWKWRMDKNGTLRLLSPPDPIHGARITRTFYLMPECPALRTSVLMKNVLAHPISWSLGLHLAPAASLHTPPNPRSAGWLLLRDNDIALLIAPTEPRHGLFPYEGLRIATRRRSVTLFSELSPLAPGEFISWEQFWVLGPWHVNQFETYQQLRATADTARASLVSSSK